MTSSDPYRVAPTPLSPLVSTQWLADHLGADGLVVLEAGRADTAAHRVPGAGFASLRSGRSGFSGEGPFSVTRPTAAQFERAASALGVDADSTVVLYDAQTGRWAARLWWLFRAFGHERVAVLDGGLPKWLAEERPLAEGTTTETTDAATPVAAAARFLARERPGLWAEKSELEAVLAGRADAVLLCAVPRDEFVGATTAGRPRGGHIPGSVNLPAAGLLARDGRLLRPELLAERLRSVLGDAPTAGRRVIAYCGAGVDATVAALALTLAGETDVAVYDGSLEEWAADPVAPLVAA